MSLTCGYMSLGSYGRASSQVTDVLVKFPSDMNPLCIVRYLPFLRLATAVRYASVSGCIGAD